VEAEAAVAGEEDARERRTRRRRHRVPNP